MKLKKIIVLAIFMILVSAILTGCGIGSGDTRLSAIEAIKKEYGSSEFKISFNSESLDEPLSDMTYTADNMPYLPTPERVGFIFSGWYMDEELTVPYTDGILYLYMRNITLYPKWIEEEFVQNGTYDIEFSAAILQDTVQVTEGKEFKDFTKCIIIDETYIEKTDGDLMLRIQYDTGGTVPFGYKNIYTVAINYKMTGSTDIKVCDTVSPDTESIKTIFLDINSFEINAPIYFNITVYDGLDIACSYTVEFRITRLIGFSKSYMDPNVKLEDGYYLVRTNYTTSDNNVTMIENYNPVYSYIIVENGHYTLVKPFSPYAGLLGETATGTTADYYSRAMTFATYTLCYEIEFDKGEDPSVSAKYTPTSYVEYSYEYHSDTNKFYNTVDLGTDVKKWFVLYGAPTGFMEMMSMGSVKSMLHIDYEHIIKLTDIDYAPLTGDNYAYNAIMPYYSGSISTDLKNMDVKSLLEKYGAGQELINFFYTRNGSDKKILSSKITVTPTEATANVPLSEAKYMMSEMNVNTQLYGYDYTDSAELYADTVTVSLFSSGSLRGNKEIRVGKSYNVGDTVWLSELFEEKVDATRKFSEASCKVYAIRNGQVDYSKALDGYGSSFVFENDVAVLFTYKNQNGTTSSAIVEVVRYNDPVIEVENYDEGRVYTYGQKVDNPIVSYTWMGRSYAFNGDLYDEGRDKPVMDITRTLLLNVSDGYTVYVFGNESFSLSGDKMALAFSMYNVYGEVYTYYLDYTCRDTRITAVITDGDGNEITVTQKDNLYSAKYSERTFTEELSGVFDKEYALTIASKKSKLVFDRCLVATKTANETVDSLEELQKIIDNGYAYLAAYYVDENGNEFVQTYLCNVYFNGRTFFRVVGYEKMFTEHPYTIPDIVITDGTLKLGSSSCLFYRREGDSYQLVSVGNDTNRYSVSVAGDHRLVSHFWLKYDENGERLFYGINDVLQLYFYQDIEVVSSKGNVKIEYVTDEAHPFNDDVKVDYTYEKSGVTYYVHIKEYKLTGTISTIDSSCFAGSNIYAWVKDPTYTSRDNGCFNMAGAVITDFIDEFNSDGIRLYPIWNEPITVKFQAVNSRGEMSTLYNEKLYLYEGTSTVYIGLYELLLGEYDVELVYIPSGYEFVGWYCPAIREELFVLNSEKKEEYRYYPDEIPTELVFTAIVKKPQYVNFIVDHEYSFDSFGQEKVYYGESVKEELESKLNVESKSEGYKFAGWYIQGDTEQNLIDLESYAVTDNVTLVAKFVSAEDR